MEMSNGVMVTKSESKERIAILELGHMMSIPMSLVAVIKLKVPEVIWQGGANTPLSAANIVTRIRPNGGADAENLQRILRLLASYDIFVEHLTSSGERKYSLTEIGKTLVPDDAGRCYAYYMLQHHQDALMRAWPLVAEAVEDPTTLPFEKANGEPPFEYYMKRPDETDLFHKAMSGVAVPHMRELLQVYDGFHGVETLVDVGGSSGVGLNMIMEKYPNVRKGINFDFPDMVATAPQFPGITHVGGNAFDSVPPGDAIFMKWVVVNWTDEELKLVLNNCHKALPVNGKLILCEPVLPEISDESHRTRALLGADIYIMTMYRTKGKLRTEQEFKELGISTGFSSFHALYVDLFFAVLEFQK